MRIDRRLAATMVAFAVLGSTSSVLAPSTDDLQCDMHWSHPICDPADLPDLSGLTDPGDMHW